MADDPRRDAVNDKLRGVLTPEGIARWWHHPHPELDGLTPDYAWQCWLQADVEAIVDSYLDSSFT